MSTSCSFSRRKSAAFPAAPVSARVGGFSVAIEQIFFHIAHTQLLNFFLFYFSCISRVMPNLRSVRSRRQLQANESFGALVSSCRSWRARVNHTRILRKTLSLSLLRYTQAHLDLQKAQARLRVNYRRLGEPSRPAVLCLVGGQDTKPRTKPRRVLSSADASSLVGKSRLQLLAPSTRASRLGDLRPGCAPDE